MKKKLTAIIAAITAAVTFTAIPAGAMDFSEDLVEARINKTSEEFIEYMHNILSPVMDEIYESAMDITPADAYEMGRDAVAPYEKEIQEKFKDRLKNTPNRLLMAAAYGISDSATRDAWEKGFEDKRATEVPKETPSATEMPTVTKASLESADVSFTDTGSLNSAQTTALNNAVAKGIITGYEDNTVRPYGTVTRAEFAAMICRYKSYITDANCSFSDAASHWSTKYIQACVNAGAINGIGNNLYSPESAVTFYQAVKVITIAGNMTTEQEATNMEAYPFGYLTVGQNKGLFKNLISGVTGNDYPLTRIDAAVMLNNAGYNFWTVSQERNEESNAKNQSNTANVIIGTITDIEYLYPIIDEYGNKLDPYTWDYNIPLYWNSDETAATTVDTRPTPDPREGVNKYFTEDGQKTTAWGPIPTPDPRDGVSKYYTNDGKYAWTTKWLTKLK